MFISYSIIFTFDSRISLFILHTRRASFDISANVTSRLIVLEIDIPIHPDPAPKSINFFLSFVLLSSITHWTNSSVSGLGIKTFSST